MTDYVREAVVLWCVVSGFWTFTILFIHSCSLVVTGIRNLLEWLSSKQSARWNK